MKLKLIRKNSTVKTPFQSTGLYRYKIIPRKKILEREVIKVKQDFSESEVLLNLKVFDTFYNWVCFSPFFSVQLIFLKDFWQKIE